jgi:hypothetical protein
MEMFAANDWKPFQSCLKIIIPKDELSNKNSIPANWNCKIEQCQNYSSSGTCKKITQDSWSNGCKSSFTKTN